MTHVVYRFRDAAGDLLYVGLSQTAMSRFHRHSQQKWWWVQVASIELEHFETRDLAAKAELRAIRQENPRYNVQGHLDPRHGARSTIYTSEQGVAALDDGPISLDGDLHEVEPELMPMRARQQIEQQVAELNNSLSPESVHSTISALLEFGVLVLVPAMPGEDYNFSFYDDAFRVIDVGGILRTRQDLVIDE
jgi:hypothetical protein